MIVNVTPLNFELSEKDYTFYMQVFKGNFMDHETLVDAATTTDASVPATSSDANANAKANAKAAGELSPTLSPRSPRNANVVNIQYLCSHLFLSKSAHTYTYRHAHASSLTFDFPGPEKSGDDIEH